MRMITGLLSGSWRPVSNSACALLMPSLMLVDPLDIRLAMAALTELAIRLNW